MRVVFNELENREDFYNVFKKNVVFIFPSNILGGHELMAIEIINDLIKFNFNVSVVCERNNIRLLEVLKKLDYEFKLIISDVEKPRLESIHSFFNFYLIYLTNEFVKKLVIQDEQSFILVQGDIEIGSLDINALNRQKINFYSYIPFAHSKKRISAKLAAMRDFFGIFLYKKVDKFITIYNQCGRELMKLNPSCTISIVRNKVRDLSLYKIKRHEIKSQNDCFKIYLIGRVDFKQKGQDIFFNMLNNLSSEMLNNIEVNVIGDGEDLEKLKKLSKSNFTAKFYGWKEEPWELAYNADLIVIPSHYEGVPLIMLEGIDMGVEILASNIDGIPEYLTEDSLYCSENDFKDKFLKKYQRFYELRS